MQFCIHCMIGYNLLYSDLCSYYWTEGSLTCVITTELCNWIQKISKNFGPYRKDGLLEGNMPSTKCEQVVISLRKLKYCQELLSQEFVLTNVEQENCADSNGWTRKTFINILATWLLYITRIATRSPIDLSVLNSRTVVLAFVYFVSLFTYSKSLCMCWYISWDRYTA
jgi:hypothetical protein